MGGGASAAQAVPGRQRPHERCEPGGQAGRSGDRYAAGTAETLEGGITRARRREAALCVLI
jgi:hypothetical protein